MVKLDRLDRLINKRLPRREVIKCPSIVAILAMMIRATIGASPNYDLFTIYGAASLFGLMLKKIKCYL